MAAERGAAGVIAGRYAIESELARGGMGVVFRVLDRSTGNPLALKRSLTEDPATIERNAALLEREFRTLVTLRHPQIIQVYDYGIDGSASYYTMELLDGEDLRARSPLDWRKVCANLRDVASSLALLHSRRLIHRDVSPGNIRLTSEGRAKLIDFGTLVSFGPTDIIAGTAPCLSPEAVNGAGLDHRVDLYALGATAYYALTKRHAYAAREIRDLPRLWNRGPPPPPSELQPGIPEELDELVMSLLSLDRSLRPASAAEVMDRLGATAGLSPEKDLRVEQSYLVGHELIGRDQDLERLDARVRRAVAGRGSAVVIEGAAGYGKSALLAKVGDAARVAGATVLHVNARAHQRPFGVCRALAQRASRELPHHLSVSAHPEGFVAFFRNRSVETPLALLVDNVQDADNASLAVFVSLVRAAAEQRLFFACACDPDEPNAARPALALLRRASARVRLHPFDPEETDAFARSIFGDVASIKRLSAWLDQQTRGVPALCAELVSHLVKEGRIRYAEGTWVLPQNFPDEDVPAVLDAAVTGRLARLRPEVRKFAECLSPMRRPIERELCEALFTAEPEIAGASMERLVDELIREGVLIGDHGSLAFVQDRAREFLYASLSEPRRRRLHRQAAAVLARRSAGNPEREFEVGWHLLLAGDRAGANQRIASCIKGLTAQPDALVHAVPELRHLHREYIRIGGTADEVWGVNAALVISGYYVDPTVHDDFGDSTIDFLRERTGFALAARLERSIGAYPSLVAGLAYGLTRHVTAVGARQARVFGDVVLSFVGIIAARSAVAHFRLEPHTHDRLLQVLAPAKRLARNNPLRVVHDLIEIAFAASRGLLDEVHDGYVDQLARLPKVSLLQEGSRHHYEAGLLCDLGRYKLFRMGDEALACADRIDAMGSQHDRMLAQDLRRCHHLYRGETVKAQEAEEVLDTLAAQYGYRWIVDVLSIRDVIPYHLSADVVGLKRMLHRAERVLRFAPNLATYRDLIRAMYEGHRGRPEVALGLYEQLGHVTSPFSHPAWSFAQGHRAECLNALGRHEEALTVCADALRHIGARARVYVLAYQQLEREYAIALAGLGRAAEAARQLDELLSHHAHDSHPLLIGLLHRDRARVARKMCDHVVFRAHYESMRVLFSSTENPALLGQVGRLCETATAFSGYTQEDFALKPEETVGLLRSVVDAPLDVLAARTLEHIMALSGASRGYLYLVQNGRPSLCCSAGDESRSVPTFLEARVERAIAALADDWETTEPEVSPIDLPGDDLTSLSLFPLVASREGLNSAIAVAAVFECAHASRLKPHHLREMALVLRASAVTIVDRKERSPQVVVP